MTAKPSGRFISKPNRLTKILVILSFFCFAVPSSGDTGNVSLLQASSKHLSAAKTTSDNYNFKHLWAHEKSDLAPDPAVVFGRLKNGFRYVLMHNQTPKDRVSMHLDILAGSLQETDRQQGLAHFLEHMLFNGSTNFKPGEIVKYFQRIGMQFGADANAHTGFSSTGYDILLPKGDEKSLKQGLVVIKDYAEGALLLQTEIDKERRVVLAEKRTRDSVSYRTYVASMKFEFPDARISKRFPIGKENILKHATRKNLKNFYDTWYRPEKMILVLVGDFDTDLAKAIIKENFSSITARAPPKRDPELGEIKHKGIQPFYYFEQEAGNTEVGIKTIQKVKKKADTFDFQKDLLLTQVADRIVQNRLDAMVGKPDTPFTSASVSSGIFMHQIKYSDITVECDPQNWNKSLEHIEQALRCALQYGFTKSELTRVKKIFLSQLENAVKQAPTRNSRDLAREIMWSLNEDRVFTSPRQEQQLFAPVINALTPKDLHDAFRRTWAPGHRLVMVTGNAALSDKPSNPNKQILSVYHTSQTVAVSKPAEFKPVTFPYLADPVKKGPIVRRSTIPDLGIVQVDFQNGVRLNVKKTDFEANEVLLKFSFGRGHSAEPPDQPGLADLSVKVINESGLGALEKEELERAMAGKNTSLTFGIGEDCFFFSGKTVPGEVRLLFQLLYAHLIDPGFREDAYTLAMERFKQDYLALSSSIDGAMVLSGKRFLAGGDSRFGLPQFEDFKRLTLDQIRAWFYSSLKTAPMEVSVVGNVDVASVVTAASRYLGSLPFKHHAALPQTAPLPPFPADQTLQISVDTEIPKGLVVVAYPTEDLWQISRTRRFSLLASVVSDRLREQIREKMGSAYSTFAFNTPSRIYPGYGVFKIMVNVDPKEADIVVRAVKQLITKLDAEGVFKGELKRAITPTLTSIKDMKRNNGYWLNTVLTGSRQHPQQLEWSRTIVPDYASITKEEVSAIARQYLDNRKAAVVIVTPKNAGQIKQKLSQK